jgi:hypothetical protein
VSPAAKRPLPLGPAEPDAASPVLLHPDDSAIVLEPPPGDAEAAIPFPAGATAEAALEPIAPVDAATGGVFVLEEAPPPRGLVARIGYGIAVASSCVFGSVSLIFGLAVIASIPIVQFLSLGYLLEAAGRIGRSGRLRDAFPGVRVAARLGGIVLGSLPWLTAWGYLGDVLIDAQLIDPMSAQTQALGLLGLACTVLIPLHIALAISRGGRLRYFFWPNFLWFVRLISRGGYFREAWTSTVSFVRGLRLPHYFWLGLRGYLGAGALLLVPSTLYATGQLLDPQLPLDASNGITLITFLVGLVLMAVVLLYVPFLQVHFAAENRFRAMFELGMVRERFRRAPIAFFFAFVFTLLLALPLYLFKIEVVPRDALWLPALVFIVTIFPVKVMCGWAYGRAGRRLTRAHFFFRFVCRILMLPVALFYALFVFFTQYTGWHGVLSLYEHHAFLLPVPF